MEEAKSEGQPHHFGLGTWKGELPCTEMGKLGGGGRFWWKDSAGDMFEVSSQHSSGDASRQLEGRVWHWASGRGWRQNSGSPQLKMGKKHFVGVGRRRRGSRTEVGEKMRNRGIGKGDGSEQMEWGVVRRKTWRLY